MLKKTSPASSFASLERYLETPLNEDAVPMGYLQAAEPNSNNPFGFQVADDGGDDSGSILGVNYHRSPTSLANLALQKEYSMRSASEFGLEGLQNEYCVPPRTRQPMFTLGASSDEASSIVGSEREASISASFNPVVFSDTSTSASEVRTFESMLSLRSLGSFESRNSRLSVDSRGSRRGRRKWLGASTSSNTPFRVHSRTSIVS